MKQTSQKKIYNEVSLTKNLRGKPAKIRLGKVQENLEKDSPWLLVLPWNERLHGVGAQVIMELVHMHEGCAIQLTYDRDCTYSWTVLLPYTVVRTVDFSCNSVNSHSFATTHLPSLAACTIQATIILLALSCQLILLINARATWTTSTPLQSKRKSGTRSPILLENPRTECQEEEEVVWG